MLIVGFRLFQLVACPQKWKHSCRFAGHACHLLNGGSASNYSRRAPDRANKVAKGVVHVYKVRMGPSWIDPIVKFLKDDILPEDKSEAEKIRRKAPWFWLSEDHKLYKRSYSGPYLLCVHPEASKLLLEELHGGICGSHTGGRSLLHRAIIQGYWWPGMQKEALEYVKKCD